jgi:hypothetical protein
MTTPTSLAAGTPTASALDLVRLFQKLGRNIETLEILDLLQASLGAMAESNNDDRKLLIDANDFRQVNVPQP